MSDKTTRTTFVSFLLDETGSMQSIKDDTVGGFNAYIETLQKDGDGILFSLVSFNSSQTQKRYVAEPINQIKPLTDDDYQPRAMTPSREAVMRKGSTSMSRRRVTVSGALLVWMVLSTKCPVSDASMAICAVSRSRISPTMTMSGS